MDIFSWLSEALSDLTAGIIGFFTALLQQLFGLFGSMIASWMVEQGFSLSIPSEVFNVLDEITLSIGYILPLYALVPLITFMLTFYIAKFVLSIFMNVTKFFKIG